MSRIKTTVIGLLLVIGGLLYRNQSLNSDYAIPKVKLEIELNEDLNELNSNLIDLKSVIEGSNKVITGFEEYINSLDNEEYNYYTYYGDSLKFWSTNSIKIDHQLTETSFFGNLIRLKKGWFLVQTLDFDQFKLVGLKSIQRIFPYENEYLKNRFTTRTLIHENCEITIHQPDDNYALITLGNGDTKFFINHINVALDQNGPVTISFILVLLGIILLLVSLQKSILFSSKNWVLLLYIAGIFLVRFLTLYFSISSDYFDIPLFGPVLYAGSFLAPSLGDFTLNILIIIYVTFLFNTRFHIKNFSLKEKSRVFQLALSVTIFFILFLMGHFIEELIGNLIKNSSISFNINNLFELDIYSGIGIICIGLLLITYFLVIDKFILLLTRTVLSRNLKYIALTLSIIINIPIHIIIHKFDVAFIIWTVSIIAISFITYAEKRKYTFTTTLILIAFSTVFSAEELLKHNERKELKNREVLAGKLIHDDDPIAELLISDMLKNLKEESILNKDEISIEDFDIEDFKRILNQKYLSGYFSKYNTESYLYLQNGQAINAISGDSRKNNISYYQNIFKENTLIEPDNQLVYIDDPLLKETYILRIPLKDSIMKSLRGTIFISFISKLLPEEIGFPELLLDGNTSKTLALDNYSFSKYRNGILTKEFGEYKYNINLDKFKQGISQEAEHYVKNEFDHFILTTQNKTVIISKPVSLFIEKVTTFSYLFALYSVILIIVILIKNAAYWRLNTFNFQTRTQFLLVNILFFTLILFGIGTGYYINKQYKTKNYKAIQEKINSVLTEIEHKLGSTENLNEVNKDYLQYILNKFSNVFFTDINLFNASGELLASSQPKLFSEGIIDNKMHPKAYQVVHELEQTFFVHQEKIGNLDYLSAYVPFQNKDGITLAYLNLPYFAKQKDLEQEISSFLVALINIYVLLFALSIVTALLISNLLTKPMRLIENMLKKIELGKTNQTIEYKRQDELGKLVAVYNQKVNELAHSAEKLAKSERESAWREMARQVAHEIKNPLTPMKLSVQHLSRAWSTDQDNWDERLDRFTKTMIEQIDTLSNIASEFSNFAKMPNAKNEEFDLLVALESCVVLYRESIPISYDKPEATEFMVNADKKQIIRVFNNLIKNAIQAIPEEREGNISIVATQKNYEFVVTISDNGVGISEEKLGRIFQPNFTTKTGGMGLGLAMCEKIIETARGKIWFDSVVDQGSSFYVSLPRINHE